MTWLLTRGRVPFLCALLALTAFFGVPRRADRRRDGTTNRSTRARPSRPRSTTASRRPSAATRTCCSRWPTRSCSSAEGLALLDELTARIARIDGVRRVYSLSNAQQIVSGESGAEMAPVVAPPLDDPALAEPRARGARPQSRLHGPLRLGRSPHRGPADRDRGPTGRPALSRRDHRRPARRSSPSPARRASRST